MTWKKETRQTLSLARRKKNSKSPLKDSSSMTKMRWLTKERMMKKSLSKKRRKKMKKLISKL